MEFRYSQMESPIGPIFLATYGEKLCALTTGSNARQQLLDHFQGVDPDANQTESIDTLQPLIKQLTQNFEGSRKVFKMPIYLKGTPFQESVWKELLTIPYGQVVSYLELANRLDNPGGIRAVGTANGKNPISIVVPCHRVIQTGGGLGGYAGGLEVKRFLLDHEAKESRPTLF